jgi:hypothetical protein
MRRYLAIFFGLAGAVCFAGVVQARGGGSGGGSHNTGANVHGPTVSTGNVRAAPGGPSTARKSGTGSKIHVQPFIIRKYYDKSSPVLN